MTLTNTQVSQAKPRDKDYKLSDGGGLYLLVARTGGKRWRFNFRFEGKQKTLSIGVYPVVSLKQAREARQEAKKLLHLGVDPCREKSRNKEVEKYNTEGTFKHIALQWYDFMSTRADKKRWTENHAKDVLRSLDNYLFPELGDMCIDDIRVDTLRRTFSEVINDNKLETASRLCQRCNSVFKYAQNLGVSNNNPVPAFKEFMAKPTSKHYPALELHEMHDYLKALELCEMSVQTRLAFKLVALTFLRNSELRKTTWDEIDFDNKVWVKPLRKMKKKDDRTHTDLVIPLARQTIEVLKQLEAINGGCDYVFPQLRNQNKPMSDGALSAVIKRIGYSGRMTVHGYRTVACSALNESGKFPPDAVELQLHHMDKNAVRGVYNRNAVYAKQRREMMQWWADKLDALTTGAEVISPVFGVGGMKG